MTYRANYYIEHREEALENAKSYREENREKVNDWHRKNYNENKEELCAKKYAFRKANPGKINALNTKRRAAELNATPPWLTPEQLEEIRKIYIKCSKISKKTGIKHHVDHIVPLQGKNVRGLHVPWNLQIIPAYGPNGNMSKGNRMIS